jgi:hypothetical protein
MPFLLSPDPLKCDHLATVRGVMQFAVKLLWNLRDVSALWLSEDQKPCHNSLGGR